MDGSKIDVQVGSGAVIYHKNNVLTTIRAKLPNNATVFQAELLGIKSGC